MQRQSLFIHPEVLLQESLAQRDRSPYCHQTQLQISNNTTCTTSFASNTAIEIDLKYHEGGGSQEINTRRVDSGVIWGSQVFVGLEVTSTIFTACMQAYSKIILARHLLDSKTKLFRDSHIWYVMWVARMPPALIHYPPSLYLRKSRKTGNRSSY